MIRRLTDVLYRKRTPRVVAIIPSYIASCQINVIKPLTALARAGHITFKHQLEQSTGPSAIEWADVIVYCRNTEPSYRHLLNDALGRRKPIIYDIDDSFWDVPKATDPDLARYHTQPLRLRQLENYLQYASLVRVYSPLLKKKVSKFNCNARIYRSSFDFNQVPELQPLQTKLEKIGIVYATSRTVDDQYKVFLPALADFLNEHHERIEMTVWGCSPSELLTLPGITFRKLLPRYDEFLREFSRSGFNIGLAPLEENEFNRSKNNTKFRDYGACGIAGIYSNVDAYSDSVVNEQDGLLVHNTKNEWFNALQRLAFDNELQERIRTNARAKVFRDYRQELIETQWLEDIYALVANVPSFWLASAKDASTVTLEVTAEHDHFCGVELHHPQFITDTLGGQKNQQKFHLEVLTQSGQTLRGIASSAISYSNGVVAFNFEGIRNSQSREFKLRFIGTVSEFKNRGSQSISAQLLYSGTRQIQ